MTYGILTFHNTLNPGATLQAYALCRYMRQQGTDCEIVDYRCPNIIRRELSFKPLHSRWKTALVYLLHWPRQKRRIRESLGFFPGEGMLSSRSYDPETIGEASDAYDVLLAGADQIWNLEITAGDMNYFLAFRKGGRKLAYGSSVGNPWPEEMEEAVRSCLSQFSGIAVREEETRETLHRLGIESELVADPTMLLTPEEWADFAEAPPIRGYVAVYMADERTGKLARDYAAKWGKPLVFLGDCGAPPLRGGRTCVTPRTWVGYLQHADAVFTDSYHGLLFSLYFARQVFTSFSGPRSDRQRTLLRVLDTPQFRIEHLEETEQPLPLEKAADGLAQFRAASGQWLRERLAAWDV